MDATELATRARQETAKWWDRVSAVEPARVPAEPAARAQLLTFGREAPQRFFAGAAEEGIAAALRARVPDHVGEVRSAAERTLAGRFDLLGYRGLSFGEPVDWHLDPLSGRRAPARAHWSRIDPLDAEAVGDAKVVWELSRHQWLARLALAARLTGDERYAAAATSHVQAWLDANPRGRGINWSSSLEVALRLMAWCWTLVLLRRSPALTPRLFARMRASLADHAAHVERFLSFYFSPNTHLTGEALGLLYAAAVFPDLPRAGRWRARALEILAAEIDRQTLRGGVYFEQSTGYQRYTVEIALHTLMLCRRNGWAPPARLERCAQSLLDFLLAVRTPRGDAPPIGDADGGWLLPLAHRRPGDLRGVFGVAAALFGRGDFAWAAAGLPPEVPWLLGAEGVAAFDALTPAPPAAPASRAFPEGGYVVMRDAWEGAGHHLVFDVGPLGCPVSAGHGHADLLSVQCSAFGEPFLVDTGTFGYADPRWRAFFRGTAAHSTVTVDGAGQAEPAGPFAWRQRPRARLLRWASTPEVDFADAAHDAYARLGDPVRHRRRVAFVKPRYFVVVDDLTGSAPHLIDLRFQLGTAQVSREGAWTRAVRGGRGLLLRAFATVPLDARVLSGQETPLEGWTSADYGQRERGTVLVYTTSAPLPLRVLTLLWPCADASAPPPVVEPLLDARGAPAGLSFAGGETLALDDLEGC